MRGVILIEISRVCQIIHQIHQPQKILLVVRIVPRYESMETVVGILQYGQPIIIRQRERRLEIGAYRRQEYLPHIIITKALSIRVSAVREEQNSQPVPTLGRRPRSAPPAHGTLSLALVMAWVAKSPKLAKTRSAR